jgi:oxalate decarboxylase/phosphoglucose isomerase-like protein (cupin superfamily)
MSAESQTSLKTRDAEILSDTSLLPSRGWHDMDVKWLITTENMGSHKTVVGRTYFPPGSKHDLHRHPNAEEWEYVLSGQGVKVVGDQEFVMEAGDVCFCPQNVYHGLRNDSDEPLVTIWGYCGAGTLEEAGYEIPGDEEGPENP